MPDQPIKRHPVRSLDQLLCAWEDFWFLADIRNKLLMGQGQPPLCTEEGALANQFQLRKSLLELHRLYKAAPLNAEAAPLSMAMAEPFWAPHDLPKHWITGGVNAIPMYMACWMSHSRRVYKITPELQGILRATSLQDVCWKDVQWPFQSFAIALDQPIPDHNSLGEPFDIDFLLVCHYSHWAANFRGLVQPADESDDDAEEPLLTICGLSNGLRDRYEPLGHLKRQRLNEYCRTRQWERLLSEWEQLDRANTLCLQNRVMNVPLSRDAGNPVSGHVERVSRGRLERGEGGEEVGDADVRVFDQLARIAAGFALYLQTLPSNSPHISPPKRMPFRSDQRDRKTVVNEAEVCTVTSVYALTHEEQVVLGVVPGESGERARFEMSCHFREGHWRRPPGQGQNPEARKTVHVRPCIVRRDRLPEDEDGAPGGAIKTI